MSEYLAAAAQRLGAPEELVARSARARAAAQGVDVETILAAWAGGEATPTAAAAPSAPAPAEPEAAEAPTAEAPTAEAPTAEAPTAAAPSAPAPAPAAVPAATFAPVAAMPAPERVSEAEAADFDVVTTVPAVGIKERVVASMPGWLTALFVIVPLAGFTYLIAVSGGPACGDGGVLAVDRLTGQVVACDGSPVGGGATAGGVNPGEIIAMGQAVYAQCAACHGPGGGGGVGPALSGGAVLTTFSACADHRDWVSQGTQGFQAAGISTYGDTAKAVGGGGVMPGFAGSLSEEELNAVVFFERVQFGGEDVDTALADCGYAGEGGAGDGATAGLDPRAVVTAGQEVYGQCAACHGAGGEGGVGPALSGGAVVATFSSCADHLQWVREGTPGFQAAGAETYGDTAKPVGGGGVMPGFGASLTAEDLQAVVVYERVQFGGQDASEALADCT